MKIFTRLKDLRVENQETQQQIADFLHINQNTYSQYENGKRQIPLDALISLAFHYDVSVDYILNITDTETPYPRK